MKNRIKEEDLDIELNDAVNKVCQAMHWLSIILTRCLASKNARLFEEAEEYASVADWRQLSLELGSERARQHK